jgi:acyl carrier protein
MSHREKIISQLIEVFYEENLPQPLSFDDNLVLLESGLDSLGFAVLVARLSEVLGFDPFSESDTPFYPSTLGQFIAFYDARKA